MKSRDRIENRRSGNSSGVDRGKWPNSLTPMVEPSLIRADAGFPSLPVSDMTLLFPCWVRQEVEDSESLSEGCRIWSKLGIQQRRTFEGVGVNLAEMVCLVA